MRPRGPRFDCACARWSVPDIEPVPSRFWPVGFQYCSSAPQTGFQYCAVDSITTSSTCCSISQFASNRRWSGLLLNRRRSNWYSPSTFHVSYDHSQHLFMNVDSRYPVRHNVSSWRERRACCEFLKQGHRLSPLPQEGRGNAQLFAQPRTLRIRHADSLNFSTAKSISPLRSLSHSAFDSELFS